MHYGLFYSLCPSLLAAENNISFKLCVNLCPLCLGGDFFSSIIYQIYNSTIINRFTDSNCEEMMYFCMIFPKNYLLARTRWTITGGIFCAKHKHPIPDWPYSMHALWDLSNYHSRADFSNEIKINHYLVYLKYILNKNINNLELHTVCQRVTLSGEPKNK